MLSEKIEVRNAVIESVSLSNADHGCLSAWLHLKYDSSGQGFGGFALYSPSYPKGVNAAGHFIWRCLEIGGVSEWSHLPGKTVRVKATMTKVHAIGHIIKDDWFNPTEEFQALEAK